MYRNSNKLVVPVYVTMAVDPALSASERADFTGITVVGTDPMGDWYVLEADAFKGRPDQVIERIVAHAVVYHPRVLSVEVVAAQRLFKPLLVPRLKDANVHPTIYEFSPSTKRTKGQRIEAMQPKFKQGKVYIKEGLKDLLFQLDHYPELDHDDLIDSLSQHLEVSRPAKPGEAHPDTTRDWFEDVAAFELSLFGPSEAPKKKTNMISGTHTGRGFTGVRRST